MTTDTAGTVHYTLEDALKAKGPRRDGRNVWIVVAQARAAKGDTEGAARARRNADAGQSANKFRATWDR